MSVEVNRLPGRHLVTERQAADRIGWMAVEGHFSQAGLLAGRNRQQDVGFLGGRITLQRCS